MHAHCGAHIFLIDNASVILYDVSRHLSCQISKSKDVYKRQILDLVPRNNRTTDEYPEGIFHPHRPLHHIKKENIGLIEVMGLAILPGRLEKESARAVSYTHLDVYKRQYHHAL